MGLAGAAVGVIDHYWPTGQLITRLAWQVPVWALAVVLIVRLLIAPYWLAQEDAEKISTLEATLNRSKYKKKLEEFYVEAGTLLQNFPNPLSMIGGYKQRVADVDKFTESTAAWIADHIGVVARSRFLDLGSEGNEGDAAEWTLKLRRQNLARMIETERWT